MTQSNNLWNKQAKQWEQLASPLRPCESDIKIFQSYVQPDDNVIVLGSTIELLQLSESAIGIDNNADMIATVSNHNMIQANWQDIPLKTDSCDLVLGDGIFNVLPTIYEYDKLLYEVKRILKPGGKFVVRSFVADYLNYYENTKNFHIFKWDTAMQQINIYHEVRVKDIYRAVVCHKNKNLYDISTIDAYKDSNDQYTFPPSSELTKVIDQYFCIENIVYGEYDFVENCPIIVASK